MKNQSCRSTGPPGPVWPFRPVPVLVKKKPDQLQLCTRRARMRNAVRNLLEF
jgi:hypothetical protein